MGMVRRGRDSWARRTRVTWRGRCREGRSTDGRPVSVEDGQWRRTRRIRREPLGLSMHVDLLGEAVQLSTHLL